MRYFDLPNALLLAVYTSSVAAVAHDGHRVLRAATKRSDLLKRHTGISQKFESEVVFIEEGSGQNGRETFASSVKVGSKKPILILEEIERYLQDVQCGDGRMMLHFVDASSARDARAACHGGHGGMGGLIITSHESCNKEGERAVYKIDDVTYAEEGVALDLAVTEALWQDAFDNLDINFGHTRYDHIYRRHSDFSRARRMRQDNFTVEIPSDTPDNVTDVAFDLTSELLDTTFTAADFLTGLESIVNQPTVPDLPIEIGCKNCSTRGQIVLTQGAIKIDTKHIDLVPDIFEGGDDGKEINSVITGGYMDLAVTGVGARLEMFARPVSSGSYEIALFPLPVLGFVIPGIGKAGASFDPKISIDFEIDGELAVDYGIDVAIPDGAGIKVELGDLTNTTLTGIKGATLNALPFTSNVTDADMALSVAFTPTIPIGFEFSDKLSALVTVSLDLPRLDAKLTTNAEQRCKALTGGNNTKSYTIPKSKGEETSTDLSKLMLVEANISVAIDVSADLTLPLLPAPFDSAGTTAKVFSTEMSLMTSCVAPVKGELKITSMAPVATIKADKAEVEVPATATATATSSCTKHEGEGKCTCATVTTTVYAAPPTGGYGSEPPKETEPPLEMTPYYPGEQPPTISTLCSKTETLRITISTPPTTPSPPVVIIPGSKPCNSTSIPSPSPSPPTSISTEIEYSPYPSTNLSTPSSPPLTSSSSQTPSNNSPPPSMTSTPSTTTPPNVEESKGFMTPPSTSTGLIEFTGAAVPRAGVEGLGWREVGWQVVVVGVSLGVGMCGLMMV